MRSKKSAGSHVVCLVDNNPLVLNSLRHLLASDGIAARTFDKAETFLDHIDAVEGGRWMDCVACFVKWVSVIGRSRINVCYSLIGPRSHMQSPRNLRKLSIFGQEKQKETTL